MIRDTEDVVAELEFAAKEMRDLPRDKKHEMEMLTNFSADARGAMVDGLAKLPKGHKLSPQNYVESLIVEAAKNIVARRPDLKPEASDLAVAIGEHAFRAGFYAGQLLESEEAIIGVDAAWSAYDPPEELKGRDFQ